MRGKLGERSKVSPRLRSVAWITGVAWIAGVAGVLAAHAARAGAQEPAAPAYALQIERCEGLPFDVDAYEGALAVELQALGGEAAPPAEPAPPAAARQLIVRSASCSEELQVSLRAGEREAVETLHANDFAGVGQERALALATIEALRALDAQLDAPPPAPPPPPAPAPAPPPPPPRDEPPSVEVYAGAGIGLFEALELQTQAGVAFAIGRDVWIEAELGFGQASDRTALGSVDAWALTLAGSIEQRMRPAGPLELSLGAGLRGGIARATADPTREIATEGVTAPVLLGFIELGASLELWNGFVLGLFVEPGYGIATARFSGPTASEQNGGPIALDDPAARELEGAEVPEVQVLGPGLYGGLTLGYRF